MGAIIPAACQVGSKPVRNVTVENPKIVIIIAFFLPCLSPKFPKIAPPTGRITSAMVYVANVASNLSVGSVDGKKSWFTDDITKSIKTRS